MRILILSNVPPGTVGGAEVQALRLAQTWASVGHQVTVAGYANRPFTKGSLSVVRIPIISFNRQLRGASYAISTLKLLWRTRRNYDVIYCRFLKEQTFVACLAKIILRLYQPLIACPACASVGGEVAYISTSPLKRAWIWLLKHGLTAINAMSSQIKQEVTSLGINNVPITNIPNGITLADFKPRGPSGDEKLRFIFVGRVIEQKGLDVLIEAASLLKNRSPHFSIKIIGDGPIRPMLQKTITDLGLEATIQLPGALPPDKVAAELDQADLFILPSRYEGMPGVLLEAFARGLPAIATRVSGSEEIVDENIGWLVPIEDAFSLSNAMAQALELGQEQLQKMGTKARLKAEREYDITHVAKRYESLFAELIAAGNKTAR